MPQFSANVSMLFTEVPFLDRFAAAAAAGFTGAECQFPYEFDLGKLGDAVAMAELKMVLMNAPAGDFASGERGLAALKGEETRFRKSIETALNWAEFLECSRVHVLAGFADANDPVAMDTYLTNLRYAADRAREVDVCVVIEPIFMENYFLDRPSKAIDILARADHPNLRLQYDLYHAQRCQGGLSEFIVEHLDVIEHIQVAGVPDRHEPDKLGEINWRYIFDLLDSHGYDGWVGAEYNPRAGTAQGLGWARDWGIG